MKKILAVLAVLVCLVSCDMRKSGETVQLDCDSGHTYLKTLTIGGHTHQYACYSSGEYWGGMVHYQECKYCKSDNQRVDSLQNLVDSLTNIIINNYKK